jgi:hypothetical protein
VSNKSAMCTATGSSIRAFAGRRRPLCAVIALFVSLASLAEAAFTLGGLAVEDPATRDVVERHTLARSLQPVRFLGTVRTTEWLLDRPGLAATLAWHVHPALERYHVTPRDDGSYDVNDVGALRGRFRLVARGGNRRVYYCQGQFRSLAHLLQLSGSMVFTLEYRNARQVPDPTMEVTPQLYVRLDNVLAHGLLRVISPLLDGAIDRRVANLTIATQIVGERIARSPESLYHEMQKWDDLGPEDLEAYRKAFLPGHLGHASQ